MRGHSRPSTSGINLSDVNEVIKARGATDFHVILHLAFAAHVKPAGLAPFSPSVSILEFPYDASRVSSSECSTLVYPSMHLGCVPLATTAGVERNKSMCDISPRQPVDLISSEEERENAWKTLRTFDVNNVTSRLMNHHNYLSADRIRHLFRKYAIFRTFRRINISGTEARALSSV